MVDNSKIYVCYLATSNGTSVYTVKYAKQNGLQIINLV